MARADLLTRLIQSCLQGDRTRVKSVVEAIIAEERSKQHSVLADQLERLIREGITNPVRSNGTVMADAKIDNLIREMTPRRTFEDLILPEKVQEICQELIQEHQRRDLLASHNLEPRNRILLIGPPGNGKTSLAEALAHSLALPMYVVRYESVVGTFLGETANRLRRLIEFACTRNCVLFFDEFETLGKERGDTHETGEIKRVVSSLLLQIDSLPSYVVVIAATNHPELLDRAAWRRFQVRVELPNPSRKELASWFDLFARRIGLPLGHTSDALAKNLHGCSFSEAEELALTALRQYVLQQPDSSLRTILSRGLRNWQSSNATLGKGTRRSK